MNILIDIGHQAHVHLLRNLYFNLIEKNYNLTVTVKKNLLSTIELLDFYKIPHILLNQKSDNLLFKGLKQISYNLQLAKIVKNKKIDLGIGSSVTVAHVSKLTRMKSIIFDDDDDEVQPLFVKYGHPFCDYLLSPACLKDKRKKKDTIYYNGYHELAYLHPNNFDPDVSVLDHAGLERGETYFILRFNSFKAHHDIGAKGLSITNKRKLINLLTKFGKVFITSEGKLEKEFEKYRISIKSNQIHSFLYFSKMFIGDSQTMASEASVLGVPSIRCNSFAGRISYLTEQEKKYKLTFAFKPYESEKMFDRIGKILEIDDTKKEWELRKQKMLNDKIDVTSFFTWLICEYPQSINQLRTNSNIEANFK
jgi:predicted glycosyltransferase